jgi:SAM-dependent methyltransferase
MQRPLYSQLVQYYEIIEGRDWRREMKLLASILRRHRSETVVDLGCGTGYHVRKLAQLGFGAIGVDISRPNILFARSKARQERARALFVLGSYYNYRPRDRVDATLCLDWSIPTRDDEIRRFLSNTRSILRTGGLLILDYERVSRIVWKDVGKPMVNSWILENSSIVRVSLGRMISNVLYSKDVYLLFHKDHNRSVPKEQTRYQTVRSDGLVEVFVDASYVRFFSLFELRKFASESGFRIIANHTLPRNGYTRDYAVLERVS